MPFLSLPTITLFLKALASFLGLSEASCWFCRLLRSSEVKGKRGPESGVRVLGGCLRNFWLYLQSWSALAAQTQHRSTHNQLTNMDSYNYLVIPSLPFPTLYYLTFTHSQHQEQTLPETQTALLAPENPQPRAVSALELSEQQLLAAGYERKKRVWTAEEDQRLLQLVGTQNVPWREIQQHMPDRTEKMCYSRYRRLLAEARQRWAPQDESKLRELVLSQGECWKAFAPLFPNRTWKQLRDKYVNYLRPDINKDEWSLQQDQKILELIGKYGTKWKNIQQEMGSRTDNQIKNRYYGRLKLLLKRKARRRL